MSLLNPKISATTISVLMNPKGSSQAYIELDEESCNVTLRFEEEKARIAGYPQTWRVWDEVIEGSENTYEDAEHDGSIDSIVDEIEAMDAYVSRDTEKEIFILLKKSLEKQFQDEMFKDYLTEDQKKEVLEKMDLAIRSL